MFMLLAYPLGFPLLLLCLLLPQRQRIRELMVRFVVVVVITSCWTPSPSHNHNLPQQEEVNRQSSIADRPIALLELSEIQRDSIYEETKLVVAYRQGKEALAAFNRQRRLPPFVLGGGLFLTGAMLILSTMLFGAPRIFSLLGFPVGVLPGLTTMALAVLHGDDWMIEKTMIFVTTFGVIFGCSFCAGIIAIVSAYVNQAERTCIDYRRKIVPCWCSIINVLCYFVLVALCFEVVVRRLVIALYTKRDIGARLEVCWRIWGKWLIVKAATSVLFQAPFAFFPEGREFMSSSSGIIEILTMVETAALGYLAFHHSLRTRLQVWLARFGTVSDHMAVAALMSQGGDKPIEEVMTIAKEQLRYVTFSSMDISDFDTSGGGRSHTKYHKSTHCQPRDIDVFVSHRQVDFLPFQSSCLYYNIDLYRPAYSWHDPPLPKFQALERYCAEFSKEHNREARIFFEMCCLDPDSASEPQSHPVYLMSSERLLVLLGPTYFSQTWCVCFELFMFIEAGGGASRIDVLPILGTTLPSDEIDVTLCECAFESDVVAMEEVVAACGSATKFSRRLSDSLRAVSVRMESGQTDAPSTDTAVRVRSRRLSGTILLTQELGHLSRQFEKMKPGCWWCVRRIYIVYQTCLKAQRLLSRTHRVNVFLLVVRLLSTSMMALLDDQADQV